MSEFAPVPAVERIAIIVADAGVSDVDVDAIARAWESCGDALIRSLSERLARALTSEQLAQLKSLDHGSFDDIHTFIQNHVPDYRRLTREVVDEFVYGIAAGFTEWGSTQA